MRLKRNLGHLRNQAADRETIRANRQVLVRQHILQFKPIDHWEDPLQQRLRDLKSYEIVELLRRISILRYLHCVESKLRLQMRRRVLGIANGVAIFRSQLRIMERDRLVDSRVAVNVRHIVRERAQRKGIFVGILAFSQQLQDKISGANVMGQVAEVFVAKRVVAQILDHRASVGVGMSFLDLVFGKTRKTFDQERPNLRFPCQVYDFLVCQNGVGKRASAQQQHRDNKRRRSIKPRMPALGRRVGPAAHIRPKRRRMTRITRISPIPPVG